MTMKNYKLIWFGIFCCLQPLILFAQRGETIRKAFLDPKSDQVLVVAHRGNWRSAPENSVAAIDSAIQMGVDIVEIDIHKTKDGQLILMHDDRVDRTTNGKGLIKDYTLAEIKKLKLKDKLGNLTEHIVPTLEGALLAGKGQIMFNLDKAYSVFDEVRRWKLSASIIMRWVVATSCTSWASTIISTLWVCSSSYRLSTVPR